MNESYKKEAQHERNILARYRKFGYCTIRGAGSKSSVEGLDGTAWNTKQYIFVFSRSRKWPVKERIGCLSRLQMPPNSIAVFFELLPDGEHTYVYHPGDFEKYMEEHIGEHK
jgi:hypothetical protein